jgi:AcrR family transcriptional regulator
MSSRNGKATRTERRPTAAPGEQPHARGRPRDEQIDSQVVAAVLDTLRASGYGSVTIDGIARSVGVARTSLYRRWPSKRHLVAYAVISELGENPAPDTGSLRKDLEGVVLTLWTAFRGPLGNALGGLVGEMAQDAELAALIRQEVLGPRRQSMRAAFDRALARSEIRSGLDVELVLDMLTGPFYYRALFKHAEISKRLTTAVVDYVMRVVGERC